MSSPHNILPAEPFETYGEYLESGGHDRLSTALSRSPDDLLRALADAGLRGRGGAGFPTAIKWRALRTPSASRTVVCNAAEGEPGTFKDRALIRANPYPLLEGMLIAARVIDAAPELLIATKGSYRREVIRLREAAAELTEAGVTGPYRFKVVEGPDTYLYGEERALLDFIAGGPGLPREAHYPPYEKGVVERAGERHPALVQNVETYARVPSIMRYGAASFRAAGCEDTPGPLLVTISGDVRHEGVFEVAGGTPLSQVLDQRAGGPAPGTRFGQALSGVSVPPLPGEAFDTPLAFGPMRDEGSGLGSGGFVVLAADASPLAAARMVAGFLSHESCAQCSACKLGLTEAADALDEAVAGDRDALDRATLAAERAPQQNRCYLPVQGATLIPALLEQVEPDAPLAVAPMPVPHLLDFDPAARRFLRARSARAVAV